MADPSRAIALYAFPKPSSSPSGSGFCQKLETYLRVTGTPYTSKETYPFSSPSGKLPYVTIGGEIVPDSHDVIRSLIAKGMARDLNAGLTPAQAAECRAWQVYVEDHLYPCVVYERWCVDNNFAVIAGELGTQLPWPVSWLLPRFYLRKVRARLTAIGVGERGEAQVMEVIQEAIKDLEARLAARGGKEVFFFGGDAPTEVDVIVGGFMINILGCSSHNPVASTAILACPRLVALATKLAEKHFPEYEALLRLLRGA